MPLPGCSRVFETSEDLIIRCDLTADHFCEPRAQHVVAFFEEILVHTKGRWARQQFILDDWQRDDIIRPLFGTTRWSDDHGMYVRQFSVAWVEIGRKNGKSEIGAGVALYLLEGDDEEGAEVYGAAKDTGQAKKVWDVAHRMTVLSPLLRRRLAVNKRSNRLSNELTGSYYETVTRDALGELGHNPHGVILDEVIAQPDGELYDALRTAAGTRTQPLFLSLTTAGNDPGGFAGVMHDEMVKISEDPKRAPHVFTYIRNTPVDADPWDEKNWHYANPALGSFLSIDTLRQEAIEAHNEPRHENSFRQFRLNQWVTQVTRFMPLHQWDACVGEVMPDPEWRVDQLAGAKAYGGLDLSAKLDLTALSWWLPDPGWMLWRFWLPEAALGQLDKGSGGKASAWAAAGWITLTDGDVIDYEKIYEQVAKDAELFAVHSIMYDEWSGEPVRQRIVEATGIEMMPMRMTYQRCTVPLNELERLVRARELSHGGNPVARYCIENLTVRRNRGNPDEMRPERPDRQASGKRIDGAITAILSLAGEMTDTIVETDVGYFTA